MNFSTTTIVGHLVRDSEFKSFDSGYQITSFTVAVNYKFKDKSETAYIDCKVWGDRGFVIHDSHKKGDPILVRGQIKQDNWEDKATGAKRSKLYLNVDEFAFVKPYEGDGQGSSLRNDISGTKQTREFVRKDDDNGGHARIEPTKTIDHDDIPF